MTTYILHGGQTSKISPHNDLFFRLFTSLIRKDRVKILMCYWAREKKTWNELFERDKFKILKQSDKKVALEIVDNDSNLFKQLYEVDVLFVSGGKQEFLEPYIPKLNQLKAALRDKIYIGSSMGAFVASKHYVLSYESQNTDNIYKGLGLVPFNILCHWDIEIEKDKKIKMLKEKDPQIPILLLDEEKFSTFVI